MALLGFVNAQQSRIQTVETNLEFSPPHNRANQMHADNIAIKDIRAGLKNINVVFIVLEVGAATLTKENREVRTFKVADPTACINVSVWDEPGKLLVPGDIVRLTKGYASVWRNCLTLYSGKNGDIHKIGDFCLVFNEAVNMSEPQQQQMHQLSQPSAQTTAPPSAASAVPMMNMMMMNNGVQQPAGGGGSGFASINGNNTVRSGIAPLQQQSNTNHIATNAVNAAVIQPLGPTTTAASGATTQSSASPSTAVPSGGVIVAGGGTPKGGGARSRNNQTRSNIKTDRK